MADLPELPAPLIVPAARGPWRSAHALAAVLLPCLSGDGDGTIADPVAEPMLGALLGLPAGSGARIRLAVPGCPAAELRIAPDVADGPGAAWHPLVTGTDDAPAGAVLLPQAADAAAVVERLELAIALGRAEAQRRAALARLVALDAATTATAAELGLDRVLQVIVASVRPVVGARYAALAILDPRGGIERFITDGMDAATRQAIGHPPLGRGILGVVVTEARPIRLPDLMADPRAHGFPAGHPPMHSFLGVPVGLEGRSIGNLYLTDKAGGGPFTEDDERLVGAFARHAAIAIRNARLHAELGRLAIVEERERIGADLHDGIIQSLYAIGLSLEDAVETLRDDPDAAEGTVDRAIEGIHGTIRDIRNFIFGLRPEVLGDVELRGALDTLAEEFRRSASVGLELSAAPGVEVDGEDAVQLVQLTREALSNVARHAGATRAIVELSAEGGILTLAIADDGRGFDSEADHGPAHRGLANMRARAESIGGSLAIESRGGDGTRVVVRLPVREPGDREGTSA
ncbi:MAG: GAF domain-containing protein [Chloroflexota bacterium]